MPLKSRFISVVHDVLAEEFQESGGIGRSRTEWVKRARGNFARHFRPPLQRVLIILGAFPTVIDRKQRALLLGMRDDLEKDAAAIALRIVAIGFHKDVSAGRQLAGVLVDDQRANFPQGDLPPAVVKRYH